MMGIIFNYGGEVVETRIIGSNIYFRTTTYGSQFVPIDSLYFSKDGVIKEYPDLENDESWKVKALERFKQEVKKLNNEDKIANYLISDLAKHGYVAKYKQKQGHRVEVLDAS